MENAGSSIERRLQALEDRLEIYQIVCGYGYAVDGCNAEAVGSLYADDGVYAVSDTGEFTGCGQIAAIADSAAHRAAVEAGCGHISTLPYVVIEGDRAVATCHTMLVLKREGDFFVARLSASRIQLVKKAERGWCIERRDNFLLDGDHLGPEALAAFRTPAK